MALKSVAPFVRDNLPAFYRTQGPMLITFLEKYYLWLETQAPRNLLATDNVDITTDVDHLFATYLPQIPVSDNRMLIKHATDLYRAKGSAASIDLFTRLIFGTGAEVYYPREDVFISSGATWIVPTYLEVTNAALADSFPGKVLTGSQSGATAYVDSVIRIGTSVLIYIADIQGTFEIGENVYVDGTQVATSPIIRGSVNKLYITAAASGYQKGYELSIVSDSGVQGIARIVETDQDGTIVTVNVLQSGINFGDTATLYFEGVPAATANIFKSSVGLDRGYFVDRKGMTSAGQAISDNYYFQPWSYDVKAAIDNEIYRDLMTSTIHPAGFNKFHTGVVQSKYSSSAFGTTQIEVAS